MNEAIIEPEPLRRSIVWQLQRHPGRCEHRYEVIALDAQGGVLKRCGKCGSLEAE